MDCRDKKRTLIDYRCLWQAQYRHIHTRSLTMAESAEVEAYLAKHHIRDFVRDLLMALARQQPAEPLAFVKACVPLVNLPKPKHHVSLSRRSCPFLVRHLPRSLPCAPAAGLHFICASLPLVDKPLALLRKFGFFSAVMFIRLLPRLVFIGLRQQNDVSQGQCGSAYCCWARSRREAGRSRCTSNVKFSYTPRSSERFSHDRRRRMC